MPIRTVQEAKLLRYMVNIHSAQLCSERVCIIHRPTFHHMRIWPLHWRGDRGIFERICPHGIGHPDPDQGEFWEATNQTWQWTHGCDGCCFDNSPGGLHNG